MNARHQLQLRLAPWALLAVSASWGLAFVVMKDAIVRQDVMSFLTTRFALAVLVMLAIRPQVIRLINKDLLLKGVAAGLFLGTGYIFQTLGLARTRRGDNRLCDRTLRSSNSAHRCDDL